MDPSAYSSTPPFLEGSSFNNLMTSEQMQELSSDPPFLSNQSSAYTEHQFSGNQNTQNFMGDSNIMGEQYLEQGSGVMGQSFSSEGIMGGHDQSYLAGSGTGLSEQQYLSGNNSDDQDPSIAANQSLHMHQNFMGESVGSAESYTMGGNLTMDQTNLSNAPMDSSYYGVGNMHNMEQQYQLSGNYNMDQSQLTATEEEPYQYNTAPTSHMDMVSSMQEHTEDVHSTMLSSMHHSTALSGHEMPPPPMHIAPHLPKPSILELRKKVMDEIPGLKKPPSPWMLFVEDIREDLKLVVPNGASAGQQQYISQRWMELTPEQKQKYRNAAREEHIRYQREVAAWKKERGLDPDAPIPQEILFQYQQEALASKGIPNNEIMTEIETVEKIAKIDPEVEEISKEALSCITKAMELFLSKLAKESVTPVHQRSRTPLKYSDVHETIRQKDYLLFLREDFS